MKPGARVLGVDDAGYDFEDESTFLIGVVYRGTEFIEEVRMEEVEVDGYDATQRVIDIHEKCDNPAQIAAVLVDGISVAGFNLVDIQRVADELGKPVIASTPNRPDRESFRETMRRTGNEDERLEDIPEFSELETKYGTLFYQASGTQNAPEILDKSIIHGLTPEPVRVAHIFGRALYCGGASS